MNHKKFITLGLMAISALFIGDKVVNGLSTGEANTLFSMVQQKEHLPVHATAVINDLSGSSSRYLGQHKSEVNIVPFMTDFLKIFSPIESFKASTKGIYSFIALHEFSHGQLDSWISENKPVFNLPVFMSLEQKQLVNQKLNNYLHFNHYKKNWLVQNFHENSADTYASVLFIRDMKNIYSDAQIRQIILAHHNEVKNQNDILFGAFGDYAHRTDLSVQNILNTPFEQIRELSPEKAQRFALDVASAGSYEKLKQFWPTIVHSSGFQNGLTAETMAALEHSMHDNITLSIVLGDPNAKAHTISNISHIRQISLPKFSALPKNNKN